MNNVVAPNLFLFRLVGSGSGITFSEGIIYGREWGQDERK
jgi:hypothetical protein